MGVEQPRSPRSPNVVAANLSRSPNGHRRAVRLAGILATVACGLLIAWRSVGYWADQSRLDPGRGGEHVPMLLAILGFLLAASVVLFRPERSTIRALVATSAAWSGSLLLALSGLWYLIDAEKRLDSSVGQPLPNVQTVDRVLTTILPPETLRPDSGAPPIWRIPTGVLVQSIEFSNANDFQMTGFVWQRFPAGFPPDLAQGIVFPEAVTNTSPPDPVYTDSLADGGQVVGWRFRLTLRQRFDYDFYPFDRQDVRLLLWSKEFSPRLILVPDFAAYPNPDPASTPGLGDDFVDSGWSATHTQFSYDQQVVNTTFGLDPAILGAAAGPFPGMYFNVGLKRDFLEPFLDDVLFAAAVSLLIFFVLLLSASDAAIKTRFGISTFGVLGTCSGLLFAVILKDTQIRQAVSPGQIVYIEALPFLLYAALLLVAVNALLLDAPFRVGFVHYRNNLIPDLLYWPFLLTALLVVTLTVFFG